MIIYKPNEKVTVKIGAVSIVISPLMPDDKIRIASKMPMGSKSSNGEIISAAYETLKLAVKDIDAPGYEFSDGKPISLSKKDDGSLTDDALAVLLQVVDSRKLTSMAIQLAGDGVRDWDIEGVELVEQKKPEPEKKSQA